MIDEAETPRLRSGVCRTTEGEGARKEGADYARKHQSGGPPGSSVFFKTCEGRGRCGVLKLPTNLVQGSGLTTAAMQEESRAVGSNTNAKYNHIFGISIDIKD